MYLPAIANRQHFRSVPVNYGVSLSEVAQLTGVTYDELERLNTALTSGRVDSSGPQRVIIPNDVSLNADAKLSLLRGNGTGNVLASSNTSSPTTTPSYNSKPYSSSSLPTTGAAPPEACKLEMEDAIRCRKCQQQRLRSYYSRSALHNQSRVTWRTKSEFPRSNCS